MAEPMNVMTDGVALLERAICYAVGTLCAVTPDALSRPTPCAGWDLRMLMRHVTDSLDVLQESVDTGRVGPGPAEADADEAADPVAAFRDRARQVLGAWTVAGHQDLVIAIADLPLMSSIVASTGALEIAAHGWDISQACGQRQPIPPALAADMLEIASLVITSETRYPRFAAAVATSPAASPSDRLVCFLGRSPHQPVRPPRL